MNKKLNILNIVMWSIVLIICSGIFISFLLGRTSFGSNRSGFNLFGFGYSNGFNMNFGKGNRDEFVTVKNAEVSGNVSNISLFWVSGKINILKSTTNSIMIEQKADKDMPSGDHFNYKLSGSSLVIKDGRGGNIGFVNSNWITDINLYLPEKIYSSINIEAVSGDIDSSDIISCDSLDIQTVSGRVNVVCSAKNLDIETVSGRVEVQNMLTSGQNKSDFNSISGKIHLITKQAPNNVRAETVSGDFEITIPDNDGFTAKIDKVSGNLESDFQFSIGGDSGKSYTYKNGNAKFSFETVSGDIIISKAG